MVRGNLAASRLRRCRNRVGAANDWLQDRYPAAAASLTQARQNTPFSRACGRQGDRAGLGRRINPEHRGQRGYPSVTVRQTRESLGTTP